MVCLPVQKSKSGKSEAEPGDLRIIAKNAWRQGPSERHYIGVTAAGR